MSLLRELAGHPEWMALCKRAQQQRPTLPLWDGIDDNANDWKKKSAMQEGFDLCLAIFAPHLVK